jgi:hypothetical protein
MDLQKPMGRGELLSAVVYSLVLLCLNAYVCRELFVNQTAWMNSMHGFWIALAERAGDSWFHPTWWPYWDCGIPFEATYPPLIPAVTSLWSAARGVPPAVAFNVITGLVYCLGPLSLFVMIWLLTRLPGYSFAAALLYSLTAPTQILVPDAGFAWARFWDARRLCVLGVWDETPHMTALVLLPMVIIFLSLAIRTRRFAYCAASVAAITVASLASAFGPITTAMAAFCLLFVLHRERWKSNLCLILTIGAVAWAICAPYYSPAMLHAIVASGGAHGDGWSMGSFTTLAIVAVGWVILWRYIRRWIADWQLQFFVLFAYLISSIPILAVQLHRQFLPQPTRYRVEMEWALAPILVFAARYLFERAPVALRAAMVFLLLALGMEQIVLYRTYAKDSFQPADLTTTVEYRTSTWAEQNLKDTRVMMPGSIGQWANTFTDLHQFSGGPWSEATNRVQQLALYGIYNGGSTPARDAAVSLAWLKAFGVGAIAVSGPQSEEYWKPFTHPAKFEGVLQALWSSGGVTIYRVPLRTTSLAHVLPADVLPSRAPVAPSDVGPIDRYLAALDDPSLPLAELRWEGRNRMHIRTTALPGQILSIQVSYSPGWQAMVGGHRRELMRDKLGLMWLDPMCSGTCEIELEYDGGWALRICRWISLLPVVGLLAAVALQVRRSAQGRARAVLRPLQPGP